MNPIGRRWFSALLGSAPVAASVGFAGINTKSTSTIVDPEPLTGWQLADTAAEIRHARPVGFDGYWKALEDSRQAKNYRRLLAESRSEVARNHMPITIDVLKSVSRQHKHHMMVSRLLQIREEERSFTEKLQDLFGMRKWFDDQRLNVGVAGEQSPTSVL